MFSHIFYKKNNTIFEDYYVYKRIHFWDTTEHAIQFITGRLIKSGLEDVVTLDNKWNIYNLVNYSENRIINYLDFLLQLVKEYHKNRDEFNTNGDIENV